MSRLDLEPARLGPMFEAAAQSMVANRISLMVGFVLTPILFGAVGGGLYAVIPAPFDQWVGGSICGAGVLLFLFLMLYGVRTMRRAPFLAAATIEGWRELQGRYGDVSYSVDLLVHEARPLTPRGLGDEMEKHRGQKRTWLVVGPHIHRKAAPGRDVIMVCMPTSEVVAMDVDGHLLLSLPRRTPPRPS